MMKYLNSCIPKIIYKITKLNLICWLLYIYASTNIAKNNKENFKKLETTSQKIDSVNLVIAHPDDEVMFFGPSLLNLNQFLPESVPFNVICYSNGDAEGLGSQRSQELNESISMLLQHRTTNIHLLDYKDGMNETWEQSKMLSDLQNAIPSLDNALFLTFDQYGVSNHANHISCHNVTMALFELLGMKNHISVLLVDSYKINFLKKYSGFVSQIFSHLWNKYKPILRQKFGLIPIEIVNQKDESKIIFFNAYSQYILSLATMLNAHQTQMVWFRYGWWFFSRLVYINDLQIITKV